MKVRSYRGRSELCRLGRVVDDALPSRELLEAERAVLEERRVARLHRDRLLHPPPWSQPRGNSMVSSVNSHTNATRIGWHLWEIDLKFTPGLPPGWSGFSAAIRFVRCTPFGAMIRYEVGSRNVSGGVMLEAEMAWGLVMLQDFLPLLSRTVGACQFFAVASSNTGCWGRLASSIAATRGSRKKIRPAPPAS